MGERYLNTSSQFHKQTSPFITLRPFTVGLWIYNLAQIGANFWTLGDATSASNLWQINDEGSTNFTFSYWTGSVLQGQCTLAASTTGRWVYCIGRAIASANTRGASLISTTGQVTHASSGTVFTPGAANTMSLGAACDTSTPGYTNSYLAEFFITDSDIQTGGGQLTDDLVFQLAYKGPWSVPHIAANIVEYRSMRQIGDASLHNSDDDYQRSTFRAWTPGGGPTIGPHPPLASDYVRPNQRPKLLVC